MVPMLTIMPASPRTFFFTAPMIEQINPGTASPMAIKLAPPPPIKPLLAILCSIRPRIANATAVHPNTNPTTEIIFLAIGFITSLSNFS